MAGDHLASNWAMLLASALRRAAFLLDRGFGREALQHLAPIRPLRRSPPRPDLRRRPGGGSRRLAEALHPGGDGGDQAPLVPALRLGGETLQHRRRCRSIGRGAAADWRSEPMMS